jgi:DNA-binding protein H-NS
MQEYGIAVEDLANPTKKKGAKQGQANVQFRDAAGNAWSARSRMPAWQKAKIRSSFELANSTKQLRALYGEVLEHWVVAGLIAVPNSKSCQLE